MGRARTIKASRDLQSRIGTGQVDPKKIEAAETVIRDNKVEFWPIAKPHLDELQTAITGASKNADKKSALEDMRTPVMNIKANAGAFNYPLLSGLTNTVLLFLENKQEAERKTIEIVDLLHKTILLVLAKKLTGDGGAEGQALIVAFEKVCQKFEAA